MVSIDGVYRKSKKGKHNVNDASVEEIESVVDSNFTIDGTLKEVSSDKAIKVLNHLKSHLEGSLKD